MSVDLNSPGLSGTPTQSAAPSSAALETAAAKNLGLKTTGDTTATSTEQITQTAPLSNNPKLTPSDATPVTDPKKALDYLPGPEELAEANEELIESFLNKAAKDGSNRITEKQAKTLSSEFKLGIEQDPALAGILQEAEEFSETTLKGRYKRLPKNDDIPRRSEQNKKALTNTKEFFVTTEIAKTHTGPDGKLTAAGLAIKHQILSGTAAPGSEAEAIANTVIAALKEDYGDIPLDLQNAAYEGKIGSDYESAVMAKIDNLNVSVQEKNLLKGLFYLPDTSYPKETAQLKGLTDAAKTEMQSQFGFDKNYQITQSSFLYEAKLNGTYYDELDRLLGSQTPPLTHAQKAMVLGFLKDNDIKGVPQEIKDIALNLDKQAQNVVKTKFNPPSSWGVDRSASLDTYKSGPLATAVKILEDQMGSFEKTINDLSNSGLISNEQKAILLSIMKLIGEALSDLKELLYEISATDAEGGKQISNNRLALINDQIIKHNQMSKIREEKFNKQLEEQAKIDAEKKDQEKLADVMTILGPVLIGVTAILGVAFAAFTFGFGAAIATAIIIVIVTTAMLVPVGDKSLLGKGMEYVTLALEKVAEGIVIAANKMGIVPDSAVEEVQAILTAAMKIYVIIAVTALGCAVGNPMIGLTIGMALLSESGWFDSMVNDIAVSFPGGKEWLEENEVLVAVLNVVVMVSIIVIQLVLGGAIGAAQAAKAAAAKAAKAAAEKTVGASEKLATAGKAAETATEKSSKLLGKFPINTRPVYMAIITMTIGAAQASQFAVGGAAKIKEAEIELLLADLKKLLAKFMLQMGQVEGALESLKGSGEALEKFGDALTERAPQFLEWSAKIEDTQVAKFAVSNATTEGWDAIKE